MKSPNEADEDAARSLYYQAMEGWNAGSGAAFAAPFSDDADFVAFDGTRFKGRAQIEDFHEQLFKTHLNGMRLVGAVTDVRFLSEDIAVLSTIGGTIPRGKVDPTPERDFVETLVVVWREGRWQIEAFQNTRARPMGRSLTGTLLWFLGDCLWRALRP